MLSRDRFEELPVWQAAVDLYGFVGGLLNQPELVASPGWRAEIDRVTLSISSKVARASEHGDAVDCLAAACQARASVAEMRSLLRVLERDRLPREVQVPVARLKALSESCAKQLRDWTEVLRDAALPPPTPTPPTARPPMEGVQPRMASVDMRRRTVEVARKILGILPNHQG